MKRLMVLVSALVIMSLLLSASGCGGESATPAPTQTPVVTPGATSTPTAVPTATPAATPVKTATTAPTSAPPAVATATPTRAPSPTPASTASPSGTPAPAAKPINLKLNNAYPATTARGVAVNKMKELFEKYTNGRVNLQVYHAAALFAAATEWEAVLTGAIDIAFSANYFQIPFVSDNAIWFTMGLWETPEHGLDVVKDGRVVKILHDKTWAKGLKLLGEMPVNTLSTWSNKKVDATRLGDFKGMKIGTPAGGEPPVFYEWSKVVNVPMNSSELYLAFAQGIIEVIPTSLTNLISYKLFDIAKYTLIFVSGWPGSGPLMNKKAWESLPADIQDILINKVMPEVTQFAYDYMVASEAKDAEFIRTKMTVRVMAPEDYGPMVNEMKAMPSYQKTIAGVDPEILRVIDELRPSKKAK